MARYKGKYAAPSKPKRAGARRIVPAVVVFLLLLSLPVAWAYYIRSTETQKNQFTMPQVSCQLNEVREGNVKTSVTVTNTSTTAVYIRVRVVSYWLTANGSIAGKTSQIPQFTPNANWRKAADSDTYYYLEPVSPGNATVNLLGGEGKMILEEDVDGYIQVVEFQAEAIQADPAESAQEAWGFTRS